VKYYTKVLTSDMYSAWGCGSQTWYKDCSRVGTHSSKLWPYTGNWIKSRCSFVKLCLNLCCNIVIQTPLSKHAFVCAASKLQHLLVLESEHGPLPGTTPALTDVLNYLENVIIGGCCYCTTASI